MQVGTTLRIVSWIVPPEVARHGPIDPQRLTSYASLGTHRVNRIAVGDMDYSHLHGSNLTNGTSKSCGESGMNIKSVGGSC